MVTPQLEKLILCGKAFFKTFVAGGDKHTLTFGEDRFIIITDITYFPMNIPSRTGEFANHNTQVAIYGERGYNHFIFRNYNNTNEINANIHGFCSPTTINLFLLHEQQVGFSFSNAPFLYNINIGIANTENPAYAPPIEYGKDGQPGAVPVILSADAAGAAAFQNNFTTRPAPGVVESQQLQFPYDAQNSFGNQMDNAYEYPLLHVNYVEVLGSANNIQI
jgi:hypothetical protein